MEADDGDTAGLCLGLTGGVGNGTQGAIIPVLRTAVGTWALAALPW
jgi:hypothetical protein